MPALNDHSPAARMTLVGKLGRLHWLMLGLVMAIAGCGAVALVSVGRGAFEPWAAQHVVRALMGVAVIVALGLVPIRTLLVSAYAFFAVALLLLALVPLVGFEAGGARRWLGVPSLGFQPSEIMKVALILALARYYHWLGPERRSYPHWLVPPLLLIALPALLTLRQPDLGTAALFALVGLSQMYLAGVSSIYYLAGGLGVAGMAPYAWAQMHDYQRRRIETFLNPDSDPLGAGYHITQAKIALGSGGWTGKGFMAGTQSQLDFVPEKHTDFIFAIIAEEWGLVGALTLIGLFALLLIVLTAMALSVRHQFGRLVIAGAGLMLFVQVFVNIAMVTGLLPVVGVPLPLVSYGGTAMLSLMVALGLAMSAYVHRDAHLRREDIGAIR